MLLCSEFGVIGSPFCVPLRPVGHLLCTLTVQVETKGTENDDEDSSDGEGDMIGTVIRMDETTEKILVLKHDSGFEITHPALQSLAGVIKVQRVFYSCRFCVAPGIVTGTEFGISSC